jgi:hypothetical protein
MSAHDGKFIAYFRVSTDRQGKSGLGLAAQRKAVMNYLNGGRWTLIDEFTEIESGKLRLDLAAIASRELGAGRTPSWLKRLGGLG